MSLQNNIQNSTWHVPLPNYLWEGLPFPTRAKHKAHWALKKLNWDVPAAVEQRKLQLCELDEL